MITVAILINGQPLMARSAVRDKQVFNRPGSYTYLVDDGSEVQHVHADGAVPLSIKLLQTIKASS